MAAVRPDPKSALTRTLGPSSTHKVSLVLSSHARNGGSYKRMNGAGKGKSCIGAREICFFRCYLWRKSLKDTVRSQG